MNIAFLPLLLLSWMEFTCGLISSSLGMNKLHISPIPDKLIVGYANWHQCDETIVRAVEQGVNVVIWFSVDLSTDLFGRPTVNRGPDWDLVADRIKEIRDKRIDCIHLISIGGWNSPHPVTTNSPEEVYKSWDHWNRNIIARPSKGFYGFDGFDWDIEGNDSPSNPGNHFSVATLDLMGIMSQLAKQDGYIVAVAPAESYLDPYRNGFDRSLLHEYDEWKERIPPFAYHGLNCYAYLLSKYGHYACLESRQSLPTFDFITIQLYEGYSHAEYRVRQEHRAPEEVIVDWVQRLQHGWQVTFGGDRELQYEKEVDRIQVPSSRLVIGVANGWAGDGKFFYLSPEQLASVYRVLSQQGVAPKGFAFWNILDEGKPSLLDPSRPVWLAAGLNEFLKIRK